MVAVSPPRASVIAIGELDAPAVRAQYQAILATLRRQGVEILEAAPAASEAEAAGAAAARSADPADLLVIIALRGLSARAIEATAAGRLPTLVWPVEGRFALPSSALAVGALRQSGHAVELLYAPPDDPTAAERARRFTAAARAFTRLRGCRIATIGGLFPNLVSCRYDARALEARLGVSVVPIGYPELRAAMGRLSAADVAGARQEIAVAFPAAPLDALNVEPGIRLHLALKRIAADNRIDGFAPECWSGLPGALGLNPCLGFVEDAYAIACEGDVELCVALLALRWLTGSAAYVGDLFECDMAGTLTLVHCGGPASLARGAGEVVLASSRLAAERGFDTVTCRAPLAPGPATLLRLYGPGCESMHLAPGRILGCETDLDLRVRVGLDGSRWRFLDRCLGNHYIVAAGDLRGELRLLAGWCGIAVEET